MKKPIVTSMNKFYEDYSRNKKNELFYNGVVDKDYYFFL